MTRHQRQRMWSLLAVHLLLGGLIAIIDACYPTVQWPHTVEIAYGGFLAAEVMLLGIWLGLTNAKWLAYAFGSFLGLGWLIVITALPHFRDFGSAQYGEVLIVLVGCTSVIGAAVGLSRSFFASFRLSNQSPSIPTGRDFQFSLIALLATITLMGSLLAVGRVLRHVGGQNPTIIVVCASFATSTALAALVLMWASLGCGKISIRVPIGLLVVCLLGLIPPFFLGGHRASHYIDFASVTSLGGIAATASLLVVRSCGYCLVPINHGGTMEEPPE